MTVPLQSAANTYIGAANTATYAYDFRIFDKSDLHVTQRASGSVSETELTVDLDYTVAGVGDKNGGTITLTAGNLAAGTALTIRLRPGLKQDIDLRNQGPYFAETHEDGFDRLVMINQGQQFEIDRALRIPETVIDVNTRLPAPEAGRVLGWNSAGTAIVNYETGTTVISDLADGSVVTSKIADLAVTTEKLGNLVVTAPKLGNLAVTTGKIAEGAVTNPKLADDCVNAAKIDGTDAAAIRTTLELGTAATKNTGMGGGGVPLIGTISATTAAAGLVELATNPEAKAAADASRVASVAAMKHHPGVAKAWVRFQGTGSNGTNMTILASHNIASVTKQAAGRYDINFTVPFASANYVFAGSVRKTSGGDDGFVENANNDVNTESVCRILTPNKDGTNTNFPEVWVVFFGDQI